MRIRPERKAKGATGGQATTELVLLILFLIPVLVAFSKMFARLVLVQKMEIASYYAARRWQLESHKTLQYEAADGPLCQDIERNVACYLGFARPGCPAGNAAVQSFLSLQDMSLCPPVRTQVWNIVTLKVTTNPVGVPHLFQFQSAPFEITKYVPNRDRPITFILPSVKDQP